MKLLRRSFEIIIGLIFLASGSSKLNSSFEFLHTVTAYDLIGWHTTIAVAATLPWFELVLGGALVVGLMSEAALWLASVLTLTFVIACTSALHRKLSIPCGCFGSSEIISAGTVVRSFSIFFLTGGALILSLPHGVRNRSRVIQA
jgi:uncharacterized membrane protein YphA (DoxX/SURF4 family)